MGKLVLILLFFISTNILSDSIGLIPLSSETDIESLSYLPLITKKIERALPDQQTRVLKSIQTLNTSMLEDILYIENLHTLLLYKIKKNKVSLLRYQNGKELEDLSNENPTELKDWVYRPHISLKINPISLSLAERSSPLPEKKEGPLSTPWYNNKVVWLVGGLVITGVVTSLYAIQQKHHSLNAEIEYK